MARPKQGPKLTPDGKARRERRDADDTTGSDVGEAQDPLISGDTEGAGYANTDEAAADADGLVRRGEQLDRPII